MPDRRLDEEEIFHVARKIPDPEAQAKYLDQICAGDASLRERVEALLRIHEQDQAFLNPDSPNPPATADAVSPTERPGTTIGRYRLMEQIGEGGMGVVFVAEQEKPIRRKVALKVIKPGMDSKAVVARFEAERQALAMMNHPNIAHVFDGGMTESGRPYFVMELVKGVPITEYCDQNNSPTEERLRLFVDVCHAVQHAHHKGVIHRDLKPSNVMVTLHDSAPVVKVIDFGVSKAINQRLTEKTLFTAYGQMVGTPMYMSPEQAQMSGLDVDTRTDVYSLGVLLYELLTGATPFDKTRLQEAGYDEIRRIIREEEPVKPSTKINTLGNTANDICARRQSEPRRLSAKFRGELDWVVMKALEKERGRRYDTAASFAADVRRFLNRDVIEARPPSVVYRLRKTLVRHRVAFATTAIVMLALLAGLVTSTWFAVRLSATLRTLHDELTEKVILEAQSKEGEGTSAALTLARESRMPETTRDMLEGITSYYRGDNEAAIRTLQDVVQREPGNVTAHAMLALSHGHHGEWNEYTRQMMLIGDKQQALELKDYESLILGCAHLYMDTAKSMDMLQQTVDRHPEWAVARAMLGGAKGHRALELPDANLAEEALNETSLAIKLLSKNRVVALYNVWTHRVAIYFARAQGKDYEALRQDAEESIDLLKKDYTVYTAGAYNIAAFYEVLDEHEAAIDILSKAVGQADHDDWTSYYVGLLVANGRFDDAIGLLDKIDVRSVSLRTAKASLLATIPERREEARSLCNGLLRENDAVDARLGAITVLCLLGERARVKSESEVCRELLGGRRVPNWMPEKALAFHEGKTFDEFDEDCGQTPIGRMTFHYSMAMRQLSEGDRDGAIRHFDQCTQSSLIDSGYFNWARVFRRILADNPQWPEQR
jgi:serine/threonine protein kinase/tetratricopeptide (TPR) repeat protein